MVYVNLCSNLGCPMRMSCELGSTKVPTDKRITINSTYHKLEPDGTCEHFQLRREFFDEGDVLRQKGGKRHNAHAPRRPKRW